MAEIDESDIETLADGIVAAMVEVSAVHGNVLGEVWESESAQDVLETFQLDASHDTVLRAVFDAAMQRWPSVFDVLTGSDDQLDPVRARGHVVDAVEAAGRVLTADDRETYRLAVFNVGAATAAAVRRTHFGRDREAISADERAVIEDIDGLFT